ncbi:uncharacterized protein DUF1648 [Ruminiclostridium sufflavum DSM 19573]|uniref:Uncharacterized protein DUF1648 n=1 Tax=Ruminiclostridium sufflavum DSM 19573 TaxID=1121337 RepID=A0A318XPZ1_9FIRM|nr:DUF1648 domain-containing protein [Ruminiclostridium sufflavum]PYG89954.1 uncharacterized protein DUF1648 [Ruminiclostridium sufflavum DSM 19573]
MRPKIEIPLKPVDIILEAISIVIFIVLCLYTAFSWPNLPDTVPVHFGFSGQADGYGNKSSLLFLLPVILILYTGLSLLQKFPHIYNYIVEITQKNALTQYTCAIRMMRVLKLIIVIIFSYIQFQSIRAASTGTTSLGLWFLPVVLVLLFGTLGFYLKASVRNK